MNDAIDYEDLQLKYCREKPARMQTSRSKYASNRRKRAALAHGGSHQRRNKHIVW
jgi:hypothetical protein